MGWKDANISAMVKPDIFVLEKYFFFSLEDHLASYQGLFQRKTVSEEI